MRNLISFKAIFLSALLLISGCRRKDAAIVRKGPDSQLEDLITLQEPYLYGTQVSDLAPI
jgi:hypothetical protein